MTWRQKTLARVLIIIAKLISDDAMIRKDLDNLWNAIGAGPTVES